MTSLHVYNPTVQKNKTKNKKNKTCGVEGIIIFETIITVHIIWLNIHHYTIQYTAVV